MRMFFQIHKDHMEKVLYVAVLDFVQENSELNMDTDKWQSDTPISSVSLINSRKMFIVKWRLLYKEIMGGSYH